MIHQRIETDDGEVAVCPECDSPAVRTAGSGYRSHSDGTGYRCDKCGAFFNQFSVRQAKRNNTHVRSGTAKQLADADPDDYPK